MSGQPSTCDRHRYKKDKNRKVYDHAPASNWEFDWIVAVPAAPVAREETGLHTVLRVGHRYLANAPLVGLDDLQPNRIEMSLALH